MTNWIEKYQAGKIFLQPNSSKLPSGYKIPYKDRSSELAISIGGENGEPAYLIPSFKYGIPLSNPIKEFNKTGEHLGGPFKTWQEADKWEREIRHPYVEKGQPIPSPIRTWGKEFQNGGSVSSSRKDYLRQQHQNYLKSQAEKGRKAVVEGREKFAKDYVIPAIKTAGSFTPAGPLIGLADAYEAYQQGNTGWALAGAGMEALPYVGKGIGKGVKALKNIKKSKFISSIDWGKFNKEIPENKKLLDEYNLIEETSKKNNTWMKNPDGSSFSGTPEQFIQQQSNNFKEAFPKGSKIVYRGGPINPEIIKSQEQLGKDFIKFKYGLTETKNDNVALETLWNRYKERLNTGIYTTDKYEYALNDYARGNKNNVTPLYIKMDNPKIVNTGESFKILQKERDLLLNSGYDSVITPPSSIYPSGENVVFNSTNLKSAIGNNGMFDMTNPNIYKTIIGGAIGAKVLTSNKNLENRYQGGGILKSYDDSFKANVNRGIGKIRSKVPKSFWVLPGMSDIDDVLYAKQAFSDQGTWGDKIISTAGLALPYISTKALKALPIGRKNYPYEQVNSTSQKLQQRGAPAMYAHAVAEANWNNPLLTVGDKSFYRGVHLPVVPGGKYVDDRITTPLRPVDVDISSQGFKTMEEYAIDPDLPKLQGIDAQNINSGNYYHNGLWTTGNEKIANQYARTGRFKVTYNELADKVFKDPNSTKVVYRDIYNDMGDLPVGIVQEFKPVKTPLYGIEANDNISKMMSKFYNKPASEISLQEGRDFLNRAKIDFTSFPRQFEEGFHFLPGRITPTNSRLRYEQGGTIPKAQEGVKIQADRRNWLQRTNDKVQTAYNKNKPQLLKDFPLLDLPGMVVEYVTGHSEDPDAGLAMVNPVGKIGKAIKVHQAVGKFKAKEKGINFVRNWIEHPESQKRINEITNLSDLEVLNQALQNGVRFNPGVPPERIKQYIENKAFLIGINRLKKDFGILGPELFSTKNLNRGHLVPQSRILSKGSNTSSGTTGISWNKGNFWMSREIPRKAITSNAVHEATHNLTGNADNIKIKSITDEAFGGESVIEKLKQVNPQKVNDINYFTDPTEVYARVMELRNQFKLKPGQIVDKKLGEKIFTKGVLDKTPVDTRFFKLMYVGRQDLAKRGGAWFTDLFNKLPAATPIGIVGSSIYMNNQNKDKE